MDASALHHNAFHLGIQHVSHSQHVFAKIGQTLDTKKNPQVYILHLLLSFFSCFIYLLDIYMILIVITLHVNIFVLHF